LITTEGQELCPAQNMIGQHGDCMQMTSMEEP